MISDILTQSVLNDIPTSRFRAEIAKSIQNVFFFVL